MIDKLIGIFRRPPATYGAAAEAIVNKLTEAEREIIRNSDPVEFHHTVGRAMRNDWSLWDAKSPLVKHFTERYGISHADDISGLILFAVKEMVEGRPVDPTAEIARYHAHWKANP